MELPKPVLAAVPLLISLAVRYTRCSSTDFSNPTCLTRPLADCACSRSGEEALACKTGIRRLRKTRGTAPLDAALKHCTVSEN